MTKILVAHHSHDGQTAKIAHHVAGQLRASDFVVDDVDVRDAPAPDQYDVVVVGDPVRFQRPSRAMVRWLRAHHGALERIPVVVFQVSMTAARADEAHVAQAQQLVEQLLIKADVRPRLVASFAGALLYTKYGWITRRIMRSIARREGNATDTTRDHEYTDWSAVDAFAEDVATLTTTRTES